MGRQPLQDDEDWDIPADEAMLKELSPLPEVRQRGLFGRLSRQRAAYFADVEMCEEGSENEDRKPPSGFADLSTWCCDVFPSARTRSASPAERSLAGTSIADQPTVALSLLVSPQVHIADIPTVPDLAKLSVSSPGEIVQTQHAHPADKRKLWDLWAQFWRSLWRAWRTRQQRTKSTRGKRRSTLNAHELLRQRLREREQQNILSDQSYVHQVRLPADRLLR